MAPRAVVVLLLSLGRGQASPRQPQPRTPDFCALDACNCPWLGKEFVVPEAGGIGPQVGSYRPYPQQYVAYYTTDPPVIDGTLEESAWVEVAWTEDFVDISSPNPGRGPEVPPLRTQAKMRWDDDFLYVGAFMEEPNVWANLTEQNSIIFYDPDFEVFVDPAGCNHEYKEFEMNAINTTWDLALNRPYGDGGTEDSRRVDPEGGWTMLPPLYCEAHVNGPINDPATPNQGWSVEIAVPIASLQERQAAAGCGADSATTPVEGTKWRLGFSRVNWRILVVNEGPGGAPIYIKDPEQPEEDNWVWSAQGRVAMHEPEHWGFLQFATTTAVNTTVPTFEAEWPVRSVAMAVYWAQRLFAEAHGGLYTGDLQALAEYTAPGVIDGTCTALPLIELGPDGATYTATVSHGRTGDSQSSGGDGRSLVATVTHLRLLTVTAGPDSPLLK